MVVIVSRLVASYLLSLNTCKLVSKSFVRNTTTTRIKVLRKEYDDDDGVLLQYLLSKNCNLKILDVSHTNIRTKHLTRLLKHFKCLENLIIDGCHCLTRVPNTRMTCTVSSRYLWKIHGPLRPFEIMKLILNGYNYISHNIGTKEAKKCLQKIKSFCNSSLIFTIDCYMFSMLPIEITEEEEQEEEDYSVVVFSCNRQKFEARFQKDKRLRLVSFRPL